MFGWLRRLKFETIHVKQGDDGKLYPLPPARNMRGTADYVPARPQAPLPAPPVGGSAIQPPARPHGRRLVRSAVSPASAARIYAAALSTNPHHVPSERLKLAETAVLRFIDLLDKDIS